ncbi:hypothetical protein HDF10_003983 [Edaphobacter lichenicola]|uniref:Uncharacterized protein n=1 Tax=Tunturiibacter lichenicola TaxID=2051959 RepID=A0A7W8N6U0_9BACT|nr:hypothetical protein [Edaphobacter lichenicola]
MLRLLEIFSLNVVTRAIEGALQLGTIDFDAVKRAKTVTAIHGELAASITGQVNAPLVSYRIESFTLSIYILLLHRRSRNL